jgi:hypothetical protein
MLKFCCQILIAINKEKKINTENSMFILKFCSQIRIAINKEKNILNRENLMFMLKFHLIEMQIVLAVI